MLRKNTRTGLSYTEEWEDGHVVGIRESYAVLTVNADSDTLTSIANIFYQLSDEDSDDYVEIADSLSDSLFYVDVMNIKKTEKNVSVEFSCKYYDEDYEDSDDDDWSLHDDDRGYFFDSDAADEIVRNLLGQYPGIHQLTFDGDIGGEDLWNLTYTDGQISIEIE